MTNAYQLKNITFTYHKTLALSVAELNIQANKITALIGPNGCGKSTLLNLLAFLQKQQQGQINFFSETANQQTIPNIIKRISFLPQKPYMLRGTVADNLNLTLKFHNIKNNRAEQIHSALEKLNILHLSQQTAKTLSGGEQQKVALARAIITNPDVLLMDEPFSYLDHNSELLLEQFIQHYIKEHNKTLIFSTHNRLQGIAIADNVISLVKGELVNSPLINLFHGCSDNLIFNTGKIQILLTNNTEEYRHVSIDPNEIVLSREPLISSMRNQYPGKVTVIADESGKIRVGVLAGELFQVLITPQALKQLNLSIGDPLWVNFKSNSILAF
ncbi:MAG: ATP-binding cassette domain-containing protein [Methylococcaceae bacterium]